MAGSSNCEGENSSKVRKDGSSSFFDNDFKSYSFRQSAAGDAYNMMSARSPVQESDYNQKSGMNFSNGFLSVDHYKLNNDDDKYVVNSDGYVEKNNDSMVKSMRRP